MKGSSDEVRTAKFDQETRVPLSDGRRASEWEGSRVRLREIILSTDRGHRSCGILHIHALRIPTYNRKSSLRQLDGGFEMVTYQCHDGRLSSCWNVAISCDLQYPPCFNRYLDFTFPLHKKIQHIFSSHGWRKVA